MTASIITPKEEKKAMLQVQAEFFALYDIEPYDIDQKLYKGKMIEQCRVEQFANVTDNVDFFFSRDYQPDANDMDKIFKEIKFSEDLIGTEFTLVPGNKIRLFYLPETLIKLATTKGSVL